MSEFRRNPFTGEWTLYAENRKNKPYDFQWSHPTKKNGVNCPFCPQHEDWTTPAVYQDGEDGAWNIRVFPNMYPAVNMQDQHRLADDFYEQEMGTGRHEVLVDTPKHDQTIDMFSFTHLQNVLKVLQMRYLDIRKEEKTAYVQVFKNCGAEAGMSIQHSHWQLVGMPIVPERIRKMILLGMQKGCHFCDMIAHEKEVKTRIAAENESFVAINPYASRYPYEIWILPKVHKPNFGTLTEPEMKQLAEILHELLPKVALLRRDVGYNICVMDGPKDTDFHWHLQILPRLGGAAGFENATDCFMNIVLPEHAATYYQQDLETIEREKKK